MEIANLSINAPSLLDISPIINFYQNLIYFAQFRIELTNSFFFFRYDYGLDRLKSIWVTSIQQQKHCSIQQQQLCSIQQQQLCSIQQQQLCSIQRLQLCSVQQQQLCSIHRLQLCSIETASVANPTVLLKIPNVVILSKVKGKEKEARTCLKRRDKKNI